MSVFAIQSKAVITVTEDGLIKDTVTKNYSVTLAAKERQDIIIAGGGAYTLINHNLTTADFVFIFSDQPATVKFVTAGTALPIPANGYIIVEGAVAATDGIRIAVPGSTAGNILLIVGSVA